MHLLFLGWRNLLSQSPPPTPLSHHHFLSVCSITAEGEFTFKKAMAILRPLELVKVYLNYSLKPESILQSPLIQRLLGDYKMQHRLKS